MFSFTDNNLIIFGFFYQLAKRKCKMRNYDPIENYLFDISLLNIDK